MPVKKYGYLLRTYEFSTDSSQTFTETLLQDMFTSTLLDIMEMWHQIVRVWSLSNVMSVDLVNYLRWPLRLNLLFFGFLALS